MSGIVYGCMLLNFQFLSKEGQYGSKVYPIICCIGFDVRLDLEPWFC